MSPLPSAVLLSTVTIKRRTRGVVSGTLEPKITESTVATGVRCRIEPLTGRLADSILGRIPEATHRLFANTTDLIQGDLLTDEASVNYAVREMNAMPGPAKSHHLEGILERMQT